ncbi:MAG: CBS and ACT domain-containing protein [Eubacterium sp.]|nr:CBS and ACT domain-containing protein [Eubacterium sp.]MDY5112951.1 CBS and ACT domain-containing protein [Bilifractor sp.]
MFVKDHMTKDPAVITRDVSLMKATDIMGKGKFHRLPVVDQEGRLIGLVTGGLVKEKSGADRTSLSIYELNYLLTRTTVGDVMITDVRTIGPDAFLEEASGIMADNDISVLPVVDDDRKVLGIITDRDIYRAFIDLTGYRKQGTRFVISCEDRPGQLLKVVQLFAEEDANLENLAVYHTERGVEIEIKATGEVSVERMTEVLRKAGFEVTNVLQRHADGSCDRY